MTFMNDVVLCGLPHSYEVDKFLGQGAHGFVVKAFNRMSRRTVAIKSIANFDGDFESSKRAIRELLILNLARDVHIISLVDTQVWEKNLYIITDYCEYDLQKLTYSSCIVKNPSDFLSILFQILSAIKFLHSHDILHRDIKPSNILIDSSLRVKICDFGLSRIAECHESSTETDLTWTVVTLWYRAPEVILSPGNYGKAQDMWSVGCAFGEFIRHYPLFKGSNSSTQLKFIVDVMGPPSHDDLNFDMPSPSRNYVKKLTSMRYGLEKALRIAYDIHPQLFSLLECMLQFNPNNRICSTYAMASPVFDNIRTLFPDPSTRPLDIISPPCKPIIDKLRMCVDAEERREVVLSVVAQINKQQRRRVNSQVKHQSDDPSISGPISTSGPQIQPLSVEETLPLSSQPLQSPPSPPKPLAVRMVSAIARLLGGSRSRGRGRSRGGTPSQMPCKIVHNRAMAGGYKEIHRRPSGDSSANLCDLVKPVNGEAFKPRREARIVPCAARGAFSKIATTKVMARVNDELKAKDGQCVTGHAAGGVGYTVSSMDVKPPPLLVSSDATRPVPITSVYVNKNNPFRSLVRR